MILSYACLLPHNQSRNLPRNRCMTDHSEKPLLLVVLGSTASGKTKLSLALAERFDAEIVSCDSVAVYCDFEVGTAKPALEERNRVPHHLIDIADPAASSFTAGEYSRQGRVALQQISSRGRLPIVVGGSGLYLRALLQGLFSGPQRSEKLRDRLQAQVKSKGTAYLHRIVQRIDPMAAAEIHSNDAPKLIRAIEIWMSAGGPMTEMWKRGRDPLTGFKIVRVGLNPDRAALYQRINQRCKDMFDAGLVNEIRSLGEKYPGIEAIPNSPINSPGYRQSLQHLRGEISEIEMVAFTQQAHRNYAKRQATWFRREPEVQWLAGFGDDPLIQQQAIEIVLATRVHSQPSNTF